MYFSPIDINLKLKDTLKLYHQYHYTSFFKILSRPIFLEWLRITQCVREFYKFVKHWRRVLRYVQYNLAFFFTNLRLILDLKIIIVYFIQIY